MKKQLNKNLYTQFQILCIASLFVACVSPKKMVYFQDIEGAEANETIVNYEPKIQVGDLLSINVSAIDGEAAMPFNLYETPMIGSGVSNAKPLTYLVNTDGEINFPVLGTLKVEGLSTKILAADLTKTLADYLKSPIVNIRLINFKVTVLGEVKVPGSYTIPNERISIIEAIGLAGDLTIQGRRSTVLLIREQEGERKFVTIDLTNKKLFNSPYYYLAQNDVIYIEPNKTKLNSSAVGSNTGVILSSVSILITLITLLTR